MTKTNLKTGKEVKFHRNSLWNRFNNYIEKMKVGDHFTTREISTYLEQFTESEVPEDTVYNMIHRNNTEFGKTIEKVPKERGMYKKIRKPRAEAASKPEVKDSSKKPFSMTFTFNSLDEMNRFLIKVM
jgi:hypothetical protein